MSVIIDGIDFQSEGISSYLNKKTGEVVTITDEEFRAADETDSTEECPEWQREMVEIVREILAYENEGRYITLPSKYDIHEYLIMEKFCLSIEDDEISNSLCRTITGRGAFRRFKDDIHRFGIADDWYRYRKETMKRIAIDWCEANDIEYLDN